MLQKLVEQSQHGNWSVWWFMTPKNYLCAKYGSSAAMLSQVKFSGKDILKI